MPTAQEVQATLNRLRGSLAPKKAAVSARRDIRLGLERIKHAVPEAQFWQGVHVAGTNGKGSICAYLSGLFALAGISHGRYVSPAFPERHHAVTINDLTVDQQLYDKQMEWVRYKYANSTRMLRSLTGEELGVLSPFEIETATAYHIFNSRQLPYGIVEVGMGGLKDATNVMKRKAVTVISKIDLDHQEYLGSTLGKIATAKAGIMRPGVPCVVDDTNPHSVMRALKDYATKIGTRLYPASDAKAVLNTLDDKRWQLAPHQKQNLLCAVLAFQKVFPDQNVDLNQLLETEPYLPGRLEWVKVENLTGGRRRSPVLVDAAHNLIGCDALSDHIKRQVRRGEEAVTWVIGMSFSESKPFSMMLETLVQAQDNVAFVEFQQRSTDPPSVPSEFGRKIAHTIVKTPGQVYEGHPNIGEAIEWATQKANEGPMVVTGSLYHIRDFLLLEGVTRTRGQKSTMLVSEGHLRPLINYTKIWEERPLSIEEYAQFDRLKQEWVDATLDDPKPKASEVPGSIEATGSREQETGTPETSEVYALQRKVIHHDQQLRNYQVAFQALQMDIEKTNIALEENHTEENATADVDELAVLQSNVEFMQNSMELMQIQAEQHATSRRTAIETLCHHPEAPVVLGISSSEIYGVPPKVRTPFAKLRTELDIQKEREQAAEEAKRRRAERKSAKLEAQEWREKERDRELSRMRREMREIARAQADAKRENARASARASSSEPDAEPDAELQAGKEPVKEDALDYHNRFATRRL